jgi:hypothetical protein
MTGALTHFLFLLSIERCDFQRWVAGKSGGSILDAGFWLLVAGASILDPGFWFLDAGFWILDSG